MELAQLMYAGNLEQIKRLIQERPDIVNKPDERGFTPLIMATYLNKKEIAEFLLEKGADINAQDASGNTALMGVAFKGYADIAQMLINRGADTSVVNNAGETAMDFAITHQQSEIQRILKGAIAISK